MATTSSPNQELKAPPPATTPDDARATAEALLKIADDQMEQTHPKSPPARKANSFTSLNQRMTETKQKFQSMRLTPQTKQKQQQEQGDTTSKKRQSFQERLTATKQALQPKIASSIKAVPNDNNKKTLQERLNSTKESIGKFRANQKQQQQQWKNEFDVAIGKAKTSLTNAQQRRISSSSSSSSSSHSKKTIFQNNNLDEKILADLVTLEMKITQCGMFLTQQNDKMNDPKFDMDDDMDTVRKDDDDEAEPQTNFPSTNNGDKTMLDLIGYLEACAPRMDDLIEAGMEGYLKPETVQVCLVTSERLQLMLDQCDSPYGPSQSETPPTASSMGNDTPTFKEEVPLDEDGKPAAEDRKSAAAFAIDEDEDEDEDDETNEIQMESATNEASTNATPKMEDKKEASSLTIDHVNETHFTIDDMDDDASTDDVNARTTETAVTDSNT